MTMHPVRGPLPLALLLCLAPPAQAETYLWSPVPGTGNDLYTDSANWLPLGVPGEFDAVVAGRSDRPQSMSFAGASVAARTWTVGGLLDVALGGGQLSLFGPAGAPLSAGTLSIVQEQPPAGGLTRLTLGQGLIVTPNFSVGIASVPLLGPVDTGARLLGVRLTAWAGGNRIASGAALSFEETSVLSAPDLVVNGRLDLLYGSRATLVRLELDGTGDPAGARAELMSDALLETTSAAVSQASVRIGGRARWTNAGALVVGWAGDQPAQLRIEDGGLRSSSLEIGGSQPGVVELVGETTLQAQSAGIGGAAGQTSRLQVIGMGGAPSEGGATIDRLVVGAAGGSVGQVLLDQQAVMRNERLDVGGLAADGQLKLSGASLLRVGSSFQGDRTLRVGVVDPPLASTSLGSVWIEGGSRVEVEGAVDVGRGAGGNGSLVLNDAMAVIGGDLTVGLDGGVGVLELNRSTLQAGAEWSGLLGAVVIGPGGTLRGDAGRLVGSLTVLGGGTVEPGLSPGELEVDGDVELQAGARLRLEVGPDGHDLFVVYGRGSFAAGLLDLVFLDGYLPGGDALDLLQVDTLASAFDPGHIRYLGLPGGAAASFDPLTGRLTVAVPEPATWLLWAAGLAGLARRRAAAATAAPAPRP